MGFSSVQAFFLFLIASMLTISLAKTIVVGGNEGWHYGFNYTNWAIEHGPFYLNDTLVFKYDPPNSTSFPHDVHLLRNHRSFVKCNLTNAKRLAYPNQGSGEGFKFVLDGCRPYYFACSSRNGLHCNNGTMKFMVRPLPYGHG